MTKVPEIRIMVYLDSCMNFGQFQSRIGIIQVLISSHKAISLIIMPNRQMEGPKAVPYVRLFASELFPT